MIQIHRETCVRCGLCAANCCVHAIYQREDGSYACRSSLCFHCAQCVAICPTGAVSEPDLPPPVEYDSARFDISPENLLNTMRFRRSVRRFTGAKVSREELEKLLEAGRCAPTSSNSQPVRFTVLDREFEALRPRIWESFAALCEERGQKLLLRRYQNYLRHPDQPGRPFLRRQPDGHRHLRPRRGRGPGPGQHGAAGPHHGPGGPVLRLRRPGHPAGRGPAGDLRRHPDPAAHRLPASGPHGPEILPHRPRNPANVQWK